MAERVTQTIAKGKANQAPMTIEYTVGEAKIKLSPSIIRNYLVNGNGNVTDQEVLMFMSLCKYQHLNPFLKEAYLIKYGNDTPATMVVGKDAIMKRASKNPNFDGMEAGICLIDSEGKLEYRDGAMLLDGETLVGGWATVYRKDYKYAIKSAASLREYMGRKRDGSPNGQWSTRPATMIRKVALSQALREAFPEDLGAMYSPEEMQVDVPDRGAVDEAMIPQTPDSQADAPAERWEIAPEKSTAPKMEAIKPAEPDIENLF